MTRFVSSLFVLLLPFYAHAALDFGGWVTNQPGGGGIMSARAVSGWIYPPCLNGVQEVDLRSPPKGLKSPPVLLQFVGHYTFSAGPARSAGQTLIGKYLPGMVCIANKLVPCGPSLCPVPLPFFFAPLIAFNGSSPQ